jgi:glutathione S-transferase
MTRKIRLTDTVIDYLSIEEARRRPGLRLVLGAYTVPGPWREACKGIFHVKGIPYASVSTADPGRADGEFGMAGADSQLRDWTGQSSAPVAIWNDEKPCATWIEQLQLAERLAPAPSLLPQGVDERALTFGLCHELAGRDGFGWTRRIGMIHDNLAGLAGDHPSRAFWQHMAAKYGYTPDSGAAASARLAGIVRAFARRIEAQRDAGRRYLVGDRLSAVDIHWACFVGMIAPMDEERCPMASSFRASYTNPYPEVQAALSPLLLEHRDFVYETHLELPVRF